jgi:hypothetical protein
MKTLDRFGRRVAEAQDLALDTLDGREVVRRRLMSMLTTARRRSRVLVGGLVVTAAIAAAGLALLLRPEPLTFVVAEVGQAGVEGGWIPAPPDQEISLLFSDGTSMLLGSGARARAVDVDHRGARVIVERGTLQALIATQRSGRWRVTAGPFEVLAITARTTERSALFDLTWDPITEELAVTLHEGAVTVSGGYFKTERRMGAGETLRASATDGHMEFGAVTAAPAMTDPPVPLSSVSDSRE